MIKLSLRLRYSLTLAILLSITPLHADLDQEYAQQAQVAFNEGKTDTAITLYKKALAVNDQNLEVHFNLANIYYHQGNVTDAITHYQKAIECDQNCAAAHFNVGLAFKKQEKFDRAITHLKKVTELNPTHVKARMHLGSCYHSKNKYDLALEQFNKILEQDTFNFEAMHNIGVVLRSQEKLDESIKMLRKAYSLAPKNLSIILDLANTLNMQEHTEEALTLYKKISEINPNVIEARYNTAYTLKKLGHFKEAIAIYEELLKIKSDYPSARFGLSLAYLATGDFERGWPLYESRWAAYNETPKKFSEPTWEGQDLTGKTILLYAEQGYGDTFEFARYALEIKQKYGAKIILEVQKPLTKVLSLCPYLDHVIPSGNTLPMFDYQIPLMSLPLIFKTTVNTVPVQIPYLYADEQLIAEWKEKLASDKNFKIGICWQGNPNYRTQFLRAAVAHKSMRAEMFAPLAKIPGVTLYSLQKMSGEDQLKDLNGKVMIHEFGADFDNAHGRFMDTAAVIKNLNLVVTIDTSICHFAAALGAPVWNLLPCPADWRWMVECDDTPWYPNMRLFRQPKSGDWDSVIERVTQEIKKLLASKA